MSNVSYKMAQKVYGMYCFKTGNSREEDLHGGAHAQDTKDDEEFPCDVGEAWGDEKAQCEVEQPVPDGGDTL